MKIVWSKHANYTFYNTRNYLLHYWNYQIAQKFADEVLHVIELISKNPHLGKFRFDLECNEILISKNISMYYKINHDFVHLIEFYDNRQKPINVLNL
jgi:plasmid stabilization system protein ParE